MSRPLPTLLRTALEEALAERDLAAEIRRTHPVSGGCINRGLRLETADGRWFLKWNPEVPPDFFRAEVEGLRALRAAAERNGLLRVPEPLAAGGGPADGTGAPAWLLVEWIDAGRPGPDHDELLGRGLAALHEAPAAGPNPGDPETFGWPRDGWIGSLPQENTPHSDWGAFWRRRRLAPQIRRARDRGLLDREDGRLLDRLLQVVEAALTGDGLGPHLLHGDLWGGNAYADAEGRPVLVDPATYRGHGQVDLAMMELFGGFGREVQEAYAAARPVDEGFEAYRRDLYQLYYLLVHVNLFGASYLSGTRTAARRVLEAVG